MTLHSRRSLLQSSAVLAVTATTTAGCSADEPRGRRGTDAPEPRPADGDARVERHQVVVIGAGLAGLSAARELAVDGIDVVVIEARDRVGGRTLTQATEDGVAVEAGGMWVGPGQDAIIGLADELGISTFATPTGGDLTLLVSGERIVVPDVADPEADAVIDRIDALAATVPPERPWDAPDAARLDSITLADWLADQQASDAALIAVIAVIAEVSIAVGDPTALSMLWFLTITRSAGGFRRLSETDGGAQERRFVGGAQSICERLADQLGDAVRLGRPVRSIDTSGDAVRVSTAEEVVTAERVIVAMMPADVERLSFEPALPPRRTALDRDWVGTSGTKVTLRYARPFWRDQGLSGTGLVDAGTVGGVLDITPPDRDDGWLVVFLADDPGDEAARREGVLSDLSALFGPLAAEPLAFHAHDWAAEQWSSGCVTALPPGVLTSSGPALREPVGAIHWAGTETSEVWTGYMDGAVRSGRRAAEEVRQALG